jgi:hypothetical protein
MQRAVLKDFFLKSKVTNKIIIKLYMDEEFKTQLEKWLYVDNELKNVNEKVKKLRDIKSVLTQSLTEHINKKELTNSTIKINNEVVKFLNCKTTQPLTFKYLETCLGEIIKDEEKVVKIIEYIKNKRETNYSLDIKRS